MSRTVIIPMILLVGCIVALLRYDFTARAEEDGPKEGGSSVCGDVNDDGDLDLSDPVYLLNYLFAGGPPPVCPPPDTERCWPPRTGQIDCYDSAGNVIDCDDGTHPGQDAAYRAGTAEDGRFVDEGDGTVTDICTGLVWSRDLAPNGMRWQAALQYCDRLILTHDGTWTTDMLEAEEHGGVKYDDWRLPNINEIKTLARYDTGSPPAIAPPFTYVEVTPEQSTWGCWSSSTRVSPFQGANGTHMAWVQGFVYGNIQAREKWMQRRVRAVRGGL